MMIDTASSTPVFQQICDSIVANIRDGQIVPGTHLPPVRHLAADLNVAANTVAKAYKQLGDEGHVRSHGRNGTVVLAPDRPGPADLSSEAANQFVAAARQQGLTLNEAIGLVRRRW
ncbi:MAG: GntR family transcriptional regulator [Ornithinimicrobium sp.]